MTETRRARWTTPRISTRLRWRWEQPGSTATQATLHCLIGCAIGEVMGMVIGTSLGLHNAAAVALSITLAFVFGYGLTMRRVLRAGIGLRSALKVRPPPVPSCRPGPAPRA